MVYLVSTGIVLFIIGVVLRYTAKTEPTLDLGETLIAAGSMITFMTLMTMLIFSL